MVVLFPTSTLLYVVTEDQVTFYLRTKNLAETQITANNFDTIDASKIFHIIIHGWISSHDTEIFKNMTDAYLEQDDCNVILVDWREPAAEAVYVSANNTKGVGLCSSFHSHPFVY